MTELDLFAAAGIKKHIIGETDHAITYVLEIPRGNETACCIKAIKNKKDTTYFLFSTKDEAEFGLCHRESVRWIEGEYQIKLQTQYYVDDIWDCWGDGWHTAVYSAPLGGGMLELRVDFERSVILADCSGGEDAFWDALAARLVQHIRQGHTWE